MKAGDRKGDGMGTYEMVRRAGSACVLTVLLAVGSPAQTQPPSPPPPPPAPPSRASVLRGEYTKYRANNDLLYYHLDIRVDPDKKLVSGKKPIRFGMLDDA